MRLNVEMRGCYFSTVTNFLFIECRYHGSGSGFVPQDLAQLFDNLRSEHPNILGGELASQLAYVVTILSGTAR